MIGEQVQTHEESSDKRARVVDQNDPQRIHRDQRDKRGQIQPARVWQERSDTPVNRLQKTVQPVPNLTHKRLVQVQYAKAYEPAHNDVHDHDEPSDIKEKQQNLKERLHVAVPVFSVLSHLRPCESADKYPTFSQRKS